MDESIICGEGRLCEESCPFYRPGKPCPTWAQLAVELRQNRVKKLPRALNLNDSGILL